MSWTALLECETACAAGETPAPPLEWLLGMLKQAMEQLMEAEPPQEGGSDARTGRPPTPLQKANAIARLGNLFLKTYRAAELERENKALKQHVVELQAELQRGGGSPAALSAPLAPRAARAAGRPKPSEPVAALASSPPEHGRAPAPRGANSHLALPADRTPGKKSSASGRPSKSGRRAAPRRP